MTDLNSLSFDALVPGKSDYLKQSDVGEDGVICTVKGFKQEELETDEGKEMKVILYFVEDIKPMVLNKTNAQLLAIATGAKVAGDAKGKQIIVYADPTVSFGGKVTGGLRIRKHSTAQAAAPRQAKNDPFSDEAPF